MDHQTTFKDLTHKVPVQSEFPLIRFLFSFLVLNQNRTRIDATELNECMKPNGNTIAIDLHVLGNISLNIVPNFQLRVCMFRLWCASF